MAKANIKIPKGTKCGNGVTCEQDLELDIEIPEINPTVNVTPDPSITIPGATQQLQQIPPTQAPPIPETPKPKTYSNDELANLLTPGVNFAKCKGDNCGNEKIQNKNPVTKFKSCPKCGCNNVPNNGTMCPCCGTDEPQDEEESQDYWEDSDIELKSDDE